MPTLNSKIKIYAKIMRIDKPIGTMLLLWPTLWALWIASEGKPDLSILIAFLIGTFLMRSAGCVINDYADRNFDGAVSRTNQRPFVLGLISKKEAIIIFLVLCILASLCLLPLNSLSKLLAIPALFLATTYPLMKRFFPLPQLYLGIAFSFGILMAFAAQSNHLPLLAWLLFLSNVFWTLAYDTIYAMADKEDDLKIGIKTSAITFGQYDVSAVAISHSCFSLIMLIIGKIINADWPYWIMAILVLALQIKQVKKISNRDRLICFKTFQQNNYIGLLWFITIFIHYL